MNMAPRDPDRPGLRARARAAGGWYAYLNGRLIRYAGPASVGPYEKEPEPELTDEASDALPELSADDAPAPKMNGNGKAALKRRASGRAKAISYAEEDADESMAEA